MKNGGVGDGDGDVNEPLVVQQSLLKIDEVFVYRIPPMRSADGHRAEDWNLSKPLHTNGDCRLELVQVDDAPSSRGDSMRVDVYAERPKLDAVPPGATEWQLFARSNVKVDLSDPGRGIDHWVIPVIDSSRYFALRISDPQSGREAFVGIGFRERSDAIDFREGLNEYENSLRRERKAAAMHERYEEVEAARAKEAVSGGGRADDDDYGGLSQSPTLSVLSNLSLKEGEKIHINIKGAGAGSRKSLPRTGRGEKSAAVGSVGMLLRKPPPPEQVSTFVPISKEKESNLVGKANAGKEDEATKGEEGGNDEGRGKKKTSDDSEDDDVWGDFEG